MNWWMIFIPLISAFIGWSINRLALKLLFHPQPPVKILGITFQGILPKRQKSLAKNLSKLVTAQLFSFNEIEQKIADPRNVEKIMPVLEVHIDTFLREKLTAQIPMLGMLIGDRTIGQVKAVFLKELEELFPVMMQQYMTTLRQDFDVENMVTDKVSKLSLNKLEEILKQNLQPEFRFIEMMGAALGLTIGVVQVLLTLAIT